ncbi:MAG: hypothetical protein ACYSO3_10120, partial [Planctomycetota bacterium]
NLLKCIERMRIETAPADIPPSDVTATSMFFPFSLNRSHMLMSRMLYPQAALSIRMTSIVR